MICAIPKYFNLNNYIWYAQMIQIPTPTTIHIITNLFNRQEKNAPSSHLNEKRRSGFKSVSIAPRVVRSTCWENKSFLQTSSIEWLIYSSNPESSNRGGWSKIFEDGRITRTSKSQNARITRGQICPKSLFFKIFVAHSAPQPILSFRMTLYIKFDRIWQLFSKLRHFQ